MSGELYQLGRDYISSIRLNLQHFLWRESLGYLLHPDIPKPESPLKIADVGTGTGLWLLDLAKHVNPSSHLDGFDISDSQYPPRPWLPSNVSLRVANAVIEPPPHLLGQYDIVHIRLFISVVKDNDPGSLLGHCYKLLKPGGYLQWEEFDIYSQEIITATASGPTIHTTDLSNYMKSNKNLEWVPSLPTIFQEYGLEEVRVDTPREKPELRKMFMDLTILRVQERAAAFLDKTGDTGSGDMHRERGRKALEEAEQGTAISEICQVVVGRKPIGTAETAGRCMLVRSSNLFNFRGGQIQSTKTFSVRPLKTSTIHKTYDEAVISPPVTPAPVRPSVTSADHTAPTHGILSYLPASWVAYGELIRIDKPAGNVYLYLPCVFGSLLAALISDPILSPWHVIATNGILLLGSIIIRSAGCAWNDLLDQDLDRQVSRTQNRPIARGAISNPSAGVFIGFQLVAGFGLFSLLPAPCLYYAIPCIAAIGIYPLAKRVTNYPQVVLGFGWTYGSLIAFPALGCDLLAASPGNMGAAGCLYASTIVWMTLHDWIYAHQDLKDDIKVGIKSIAVRHQEHSKALMMALASTQVMLLTMVGPLIDAGPIFYISPCTLFAALCLMIKRVDLSESSSCWWWFRYGCWFTGGSIASGFVGEYMDRLQRANHED